MPPGGFLGPGVVRKHHFRACCGLVRSGAVSYQIPHQTAPDLIWLSTALESLLGPLEGLNMPRGGFLGPGAVSKCHFRAWCGLVRSGAVWCGLVRYLVGPLKRN